MSNASHQQQCSICTLRTPFLAASSTGPDTNLPLIKCYLKHIQYLKYPRISGMLLTQWRLSKRSDRGQEEKQVHILQNEPQALTHT